MKHSCLLLVLALRSVESVLSAASLPKSSLTPETWTKLSFGPFVIAFEGLHHPILHTPCLFLPQHTCTLTYKKHTEGATLQMLPNTLSGAHWREIQPGGRTKKQCAMFQTITFVHRSTLLDIFTNVFSEACIKINVSAFWYLK